MIHATKPASARQRMSICRNRCSFYIRVQSCVSFQMTEIMNSADDFP